MGALLPVNRPRLVRRSQALSYLTLGYNSLEGLIALGAGAVAGSIALVGFGIDSLIELVAGGTALWRLSADADPVRRAQVEHRAHRLVGLCFLLLAAYVGFEAVIALAAESAPSQSWVGIALAALSLVVMPLLARAKRGIAIKLNSGALVAEATQTLVCTYLSAILLGGLLLNAVAGWWWADPVAALAMTPLLVWEGIEGVRGRSVCGDGC